MANNKKKLIIIGLIVITAIGFIKNSLDKPISNSVETDDSPTQRVPIKELKKTAGHPSKTHNHNHNHNHREPASIPPLNKKINNTKRFARDIDEIQDPNNKISVSAKKQLTRQFTKSLGPDASWKLSHVQSTKNGHKVLIELKDYKTQKTSSYHALVEPTSGRILTTWHRTIHR